jgi:hypothetical protein
VRQGRPARPRATVMRAQMLLSTTLSWSAL